MPVSDALTGLCSDETIKTALTIAVLNFKGLPRARRSMTAWVEPNRQNARSLESTLEAWADRREKQQVAIGRALLCSPQLLLMDEPLGSLDQARKEELLPYIRTLSTRFGIPVLYVSHQMDEIVYVDDPCEIRKRV